MGRLPWLDRLCACFCEIDLMAPLLARWRHSFFGLSVRPKPEISSFDMYMGPFDRPSCCEGIIFTFVCESLYQGPVCAELIQIKVLVDSYGMFVYKKIKIVTIATQLCYNTKNIHIWRSGLGLLMPWPLVEPGHQHVQHQTSTLLWLQKS